MSRETRIGVVYATTAFVLWGLIPIYWKMLSDVAATDLLAHRVVWGLLVVATWMTIRKRWPDFAAVLRRPKTVAALLVSTVVIALNWLVFIYAVNTDRVLDTSLGYFINPLVNVFLGLIVLRERLDRAQWIAVTLAALAVLILTFQVGHLPWISLVLAFSFAFYGLLRKTVNADAVVGLTFETGVMAPFAIAFLMVIDARGSGSLGHHGWSTDILLMLAGVVTVVPLLFFTQGVRRLPLSTIGLLQYIAPTCTFLLAVFVYGEAFTAPHALAFTLIWIALAIYSWDLRVRLRRQAPAAAGE